METLELIVNYREKTTKSERNKLRKKGLIPAVFYGRHIEENIPLAVDPITIKKIIKSESGINSFITLKIKKGEEIIEHKAIIKDVQMHPIYRMPLHVDFYAIYEKEKIEVEVPVIVKGISPGVKKGGILQIIRKELTVKCFPQHLPDKIEIDISHVDLHDSIHVEDLKVENVEFIYDTNFTILTVIPPAKEKEEKPEEEEEEE